jgi:hypothetical protein
VRDFSSFFFFFFLCEGEQELSETGSHYVPQAGLKFVILLPRPGVLELQECIATPGWVLFLIANTCKTFTGYVSVIHKPFTNINLLILIITVTLKTLFLPFLQASLGHMIRERREKKFLGCFLFSFCLCSFFQKNTEHLPSASSSGWYQGWGVRFEFGVSQFSQILNLNPPDLSLPSS